MDDFLLRAFAAGVGVALVAGPLGCFIVWRRMAYFGSTLSHAALLGIALGFLLGVNVYVGIFAVSVAVSLLLASLRQNRRLVSDTLLGITAHAALALGLLVLAGLPSLRLDLLSYLFGDILAVAPADLLWIYGGGVLALGVLALLWRPLLLLTVHEELAQVEGVAVPLVRLAFMIVIGLVIAAAMKIVGVLLIVSMLIIPAAAARQVSRSPLQMALVAAVIGAAAVALGLAASMAWNWPAGPAIVAAATGLFVALLPAGALQRT